MVHYLVNYLTNHITTEVPVAAKVQISPPRLCVPFFDFLGFWTPIPQEFLVPQESPFSFLGNHHPHSLFSQGQFLRNSLSWGVLFLYVLVKVPQLGVPDGYGIGQEQKK